MRVSIIGSGYVGLVSGVCLASKGHDVVCVDVDSAKVDQINAGIAPIYEAGLEDLLRSNLNRTFRATTDLHAAVLGTDATLITVGTPFADGDLDLRFIQNVALQIGAVLNHKADYHVVIVKSTVPPGTTENVVLASLERASKKKAGLDFGVGMNPEFLRQGEAVRDFLFPDRIVLGAIDQRTGEAMEELYARFSGVDRLRTSLCTAEMIKFSANALFATLISFANEIGNLCQAHGAVDVVDVMQGVHLDQRLSPISETGRRIKPGLIHYLEAGCGFGGSCFPKDVRALIAHGGKLGSPMRILNSVMEVNNAQPQTVLDLLHRHFPVLTGIRVAVLGLAFKSGTDDMRESPAIPIIKDLLSRKAVVRAFDPVAMLNAGKVLGPGAISFAATLPEAIGDAEAVLLLTCWPEFETIPQILASLPNAPLLIDGRRMLDKRTIKRYEGIGLSAARGVQVRCTAAPQADLPLPAAGNNSP